MELQIEIKLRLSSTKSLTSRQKKSFQLQKGSIWYLPWSHDPTTADFFRRRSDHFICGKFFPMTAVFPLLLITTGSGSAISGAIFTAVSFMMVVSFFLWRLTMRQLSTRRPFLIGCWLWKGGAFLIGRSVMTGRRCWMLIGSWMITALLGTALGVGGDAVHWTLLFEVG